MSHFKALLMVSILTLVFHEALKAQVSMLGFSEWHEERLTQLQGTHTFSHSQMIRSGSLRGIFYENKIGTPYYFRLYGLQHDFIYNSNLPHGYNNGSIFDAKGINSRISVGSISRVGPLTLQLQPEFILSSNRPFQTVPIQFSDSYWQIYAREFGNRIDAPYRYSDGAYHRVLLGNSSIRLNWRSVSFGFSNEYIWWGPGLRHSLQMTSNAEGFHHITLNTRKPISTRIGGVEFQYILGKLENNDFRSLEPRFRPNGSSFITAKRNDDRVITGLTLVWSPSFLDGLSLGGARSFIGYVGDFENTIDYFPLFQALQKSRFQTEDNVRGNDRLDQRLSVFFRWVFPASNVEFYGEFGREDHGADIRDIFLEPEHSRAYVLGFQKDHRFNAQYALFFGSEVVQLSTTSTTTVRPAPSWYVHHIVRHGYTHNGQILGSSAGVGGSNQLVWATLYTEVGEFGIELSRHGLNQDLYHYLANAFETARRPHSTDIMIRYNKAFGNIATNFTMAKSNVLNRFSLPFEDSNGKLIRRETNYMFTSSIRYSF